MSESNAVPEFSRVKTVAELSAGQKTVRLEANESERAALARRFGLVSVEDLTVIWTSRGWRKNGVKLTGRILSSYIQRCVRTLDPMTIHVDEAIEIKCLPEDSMDQLEQDGELILAFEDDEAPEPIVDGRLDLGELASQYLAMSIDPYAKSPDVEAGANLDGNTVSDRQDAQNQAETEAAPKPFAILEQLKNRTE